MRPTTASPCITTKRVVETRDFYIRHFGARAVFDCGWFVSLEFETGLSLQFMEPQGEQPTCDTAGLTYNLCVDDVDGEHRAMTAVGLVPVMPIEDHPWGDRGFAIQDPNGITLYIYSNREPSHEFRQFYAPRIDHDL
ncbi:VOC family protein [Aminobacter sp. SR38]|jgi:catechol 2,3-dioxygenase-like lactoylglutathione lyase family enzyme|uniref:VOC family protein n=1 Tax=Aminobacter TaxID=31988 RepID=UPI001786208F|nr:VOC family protein [Aminobacter sp. SR38]QOF73944.1 VOC family protein [Aminobacter sp. SR38]